MSSVVRLSLCSRLEAPTLAVVNFDNTSDLIRRTNYEKTGKDDHL